MTDDRAPINPGAPMIPEEAEVAACRTYRLEWTAAQGRLKVTRYITDKTGQPAERWLILDGRILSREPALLELLARAVDAWCGAMSEDA